MKYRIKKLRKELNLTQDAFASELGIVRNTVSQYEIGTRVPSNAVISLICTKYCVNEEWLRNGTGEMFNNEDKELEYYLGQISADTDEFKRSLIKNICKLSPEEWGTLKRVVTETYIDSKKDI